MKLAVLLLAATAQAQPVPNIREALSCPNTRDGSQPYQVSTQQDGHLRRIVINAPNAVCNDGTPAEMYVRAAASGATEPDGPSANRWVIHLLGGSNCTEYEECAARWCGIGQWEGTLMTTKFSGNARNVDGLLGRNAVNRLGNRNQVLMKYCSSDQWQGRKSDSILRSEIDPTRVFSLHFRGATIIDAALDMLERGVPGMPRLTDATDVLWSGDSAGSSGARAHLDRVAARLRAANPNVRVRGQFEASFNPNFNGLNGIPAGDPRDPNYATKTEKFNRVSVELRNAQLDESCLAAHPNARYLCVDDAYLNLNHLTTPFFQIQDISDPLMVNGLLENGFDATPAEFARGLHDQLTQLTNIRSTAEERAAITLAPGVAARHCAVHVTFSNDDGFLGKKIPGPNNIAYSYYDVLWNWLFNLTPASVFAPKPPETPLKPAIDATCNAKAPTAPAAPTIATASSASYDFDGPVAPESIVVTFGSGLATNTVTAATTPWPTSLGGTTIQITDARGTSRAAPIYYVTPTQIAYLIPAGTAPGNATVAIGTQRHTITVAETAPGIYSANQRGTGVASATYLKVNARGQRSEGLLFNPTTLEAAPIPVAAGDQIYLLLYGTGLRGGSATATVNDIQVAVAGPVAQGQYQGLDQINLGPLPFRIGAGAKEIVIRQGDRIANIVTVAFRAQ